MIRISLEPAELDELLNTVDFDHQSPEPDELDEAEEGVIDAE